MRETTIRRLLVIVLCASGVVALWIVADRSLSTPDAVIPVQPGAASPSGIRPAPSIVPTSASQPPTPAATETATPGWAGHRTDRRSGQEPASQHQPAGRQLPGTDRRPAAVRGLRVVQADHDSITIRWNPVTRAAGTDQATRRAGRVSYYHATLNGIPVGDTAGLELTINWFNDDMTSHFIRVTAIAPDGIRGLSGNALVVDRPAAPTPTPPAPPASPPAPPDSSKAGPTPTSEPSPNPVRTTPPAPPSSASPTPSQTPTPTVTPTPPDTLPPSSPPPQSEPPVAPVTPGDPDSAPALAPTDPTAPAEPPVLADSAPPPPASDPH